MATTIKTTAYWEISSKVERLAVNQHTKVRFPSFPAKYNTQPTLKEETSMTIEELEQKYSRIPLEMKKTRRWVGYKVEIRDGKQTKVPYNAILGSFAKSNDPSTWTTFNVAVSGCVKYGFAGIGFMLGKDSSNDIHYLGIDLDNHGEEDFETIANDFIETLNSYTEYSHSGKGIHIICKGTKPVGRCRKSNIEMYDNGRFFTMSGNVINNVPIEDRTEEVQDLWEKYLKDDNDTIMVNNNGEGGITFGRNMRATNVEIKPTNISDYELIDKIRSSRYGTEFNNLFNGDKSAYGGDHSKADLALCKILAFWTGCDQMQMDRIFRSSGLMRDKWDQKRNQTNRYGITLSAGTYGSQVIELAIANQQDIYHPAKEKIVVIQNTAKEIEPTTDIVEFDEKLDPIINVKSIFKSYPLNDTGNAERFYDYFGEYFKFNKDNNTFMFWNGKTWTKDIKGFVRKYANKLIDVLKAEIANTNKRIEEALKRGEEGQNEAKELDKILKAQIDNCKRVSNKAGKDAMLSELHELHDFPVINSEFDTQDYLLNTDSGVVDLHTGEILPFDRKYMLSKNTNCKVDFSEPTVWLKFLHDIFKRPNKAETEELIVTIQMALGEALTGRTNKEHLYILYGSGSNGKSTFMRVVNDIFGDYGTSMNSDMLVQNNSSSQSNEFSLSALLGARMVSTSETAEGKRLDEVLIKKMLGGEMITAQFKYGQPFQFMPTFSPFMSTNNKPIIRATDFGTWRRIFFIPFLNTFTEQTKDVEMPKKLAAESAKILGWMIQGAVRLYTEFQDKLPKPKCLEEALSEYKKELDVVVAFLNDRCLPIVDAQVDAAALYQEYKDWAKNNSEYLFSESRFKLELPKKGYKLIKDISGKWVYSGLKLAKDVTGLIVFGKQ